MTASLLDRLHRRVTEAAAELWDRTVDPADALYDADGVKWQSLRAGAGSRLATGAAFATEAEHADLRRQCRELALGNEFAINGHENRVSYLVGPGHSYRATVKKDRSAPPALAAAVQAVLDEFIRRNQWHRRQQEIVLRRDRDGEVFLRFFVDGQGGVWVRFVEPDQVAAPAELAQDPRASYGILAEPHDVETPLAYFIDGDAVPADEIQHRKANVDFNVKRGLPLFYPVRKNLRRAEKLLRNMSTVAEIQSAIALIRKHQTGTRTAVQQFVAGQADVQATNPATGRSMYYKRYAPGTILDAPGGIDYEFPAAGLDAGSFVTVLQAELRAIASRLVMPEFMLTSDASNANYSSTMVAEGPAVKMFERLQAQQVAEDLEAMWRAVRAAAEAGLLPGEAQSEIEITAVPPSLAVRDQLREAQVSQIEFGAGILSPQTWCQRRGLDYDQEQANLRLAKAAAPRD